MSLLSCTELGISIGDTRVCEQLDLVFEPGQCWGILGRNGVGKTTLLHTLANLRAPQQGQVRLLDRPITEWPRRKLAQTLGVLIQGDQHPFPATVLETALTGRHPHIGAWHSETDQDEALARAALTAVDLEVLADRQLDSLSGGERQRLSLATILVQVPRVFLLDEPTNHLDLHYQISLFDMFARRARENESLLLMTLHDINLAARFCDHLILLFGDGEVAQGTTEDMLREDYLERLYQHPIVRMESAQGIAFLPR